MYYDDHAPPHFHAYYGGDGAAIAIDSLDIVHGKLPRRALSLVVEWAIAHRAELRRDWERAAAHASLEPIAPLE